MYVVIINLENEMKIPVILLPNLDTVKSLFSSIEKNNEVFVTNKRWNSELKKLEETPPTRSEYLGESDGFIRFKKDNIDPSLFFKNGAYFQGTGICHLSYKKVEVGQPFLDYFSDD